MRGSHLSVAFSSLKPSSVNETPCTRAPLEGPLGLREAPPETLATHLPATPTTSEHRLSLSCRAPQPWEPTISRRSLNYGWVMWGPGALCWSVPPHYCTGLAPPARCCPAPRRPSPSLSRDDDGKVSPKCSSHTLFATQFQG